MVKSLDKSQGFIMLLMLHQFMALAPPKFHVYLEYSNPEEKNGIRFNLSIEELDRTFITPYKEKKSFWFLGRLMNPSCVTRVIIFCSEEDADKLVLPNREMVAGHPNKPYVMEKIEMGRVKGVTVCTEKFLDSISCARSR
jgi:hypothetical protein